MRAHAAAKHRRYPERREALPGKLEEVALPAAGGGGGARGRRPPPAPANAPLAISPEALEIVQVFKRPGPPHLLRDP